MRQWVRSLQGQRRLAILDGSNIGTSTRNASARIINSESVTQRNCASIFESVPRLNSHPTIEQRAANNCCVNLC